MIIQGDGVIVDSARELNHFNDLDWMGCQIIILDRIIFDFVVLDWNALDFIRPLLDYIET